MTKRFNGETSPEETLEQKKERLRPVFQRSLEFLQDPNKSLWDGALIVVRRLPHEFESVPGLVVLDIRDDGIELGHIEEDEEIGSRVFMTWEEIVDAKEE